MSALATKPVERKSSSGSEQRDFDRQPFSASLELFDLERGTSVLVARTSDLSAGGCYVDSMSNLSPGSQFRLRISHADKIMEAVCMVAYGSPNNGFGISFVYMSPQDQKTLHLWLCDLRGELHTIPSFNEGTGAEMQFQRSEREILTDLISLLLNRGIIAVGDGTRLLRELSAHCHPKP